MNTALLSEMNGKCRSRAETVSNLETLNVEWKYHNQAKL